MNERKYKILIVNDSETDMEILMGGIAAEDRILQPVYSGSEALEDVKREAPDLVLLDVMLPDLNGYEVCRALKSDRTTMKVPVIFLSSLHTKSDIAKGLELGAIDYIVKPYDIAEVAAKIKNHLLLQTEHRRSLSRLKGLASSISDVAVVIDKDMNVLEILGHYQKYFPMMCELKNGDNLKDFLPEQIKRQFSTALMTALSTGETFEFETEVSNDGEKFILQVAMSLVEESALEDEMVISAKILDVTARKQAERQVDLTYEYQKRSRFFNSILSGTYTAEQQNQLLSIYGVEGQKPLVCYMVATATDEGEYSDVNLRSNIGEWLLEKGYGWIWHSNFGIGVLMQYPNTRSEISKVACLLKESIEMRFPKINIRIGVASDADTAMTFKQLYYDAVASLMRVIDIGDEFAFIPHDKNGIYEIVVRMIENMNVDQFIDKVLGDIIYHDRKNNSELLTTLEHFIMATSIKNVAAKLFIHPNTVLWRKQKIEEILNCNMEDIDVRTEINIAFKLMRVRNFLQMNLPSRKS